MLQNVGIAEQQNEVGMIIEHKSCYSCSTHIFFHNYFKMERGCVLNCLMLAALPCFPVLLSLHYNKFPVMSCTTINQLKLWSFNYNRTILQSINCMIEFFITCSCHCFVVARSCLISQQIAISSATEPCHKTARCACIQVQNGVPSKAI